MMFYNRPAILPMLKRAVSVDLDGNGKRRAYARRLSKNCSGRGITDVEDHEVRRKIIREWMALPKDKRQTEEQVAASPKRRPCKTSSIAVGAIRTRNFGAILSRRSVDGCCRAQASRYQSSRVNDP
jgi:hypothetical protein